MKSMATSHLRTAICRSISHASKTHVKQPVKKLQESAKYDEWKAVIGLEIHAQISSNSKLFSASSTKFGAPSNSQVSYFDAGLPGTLPALNRRAVEAAVLTSLALGCKVNKTSTFDRKHYFYSDLPVGYQITQQRQPIAQDGFLKFIVYNPSVNKLAYECKVRIKQLQLEQDSGKSLHDGERSQSLIDLNRAGIPLMEIVFEPDLKTGEEAAALVKELQLILMKLQTCNGRMEEGSLRVDANISVHKHGEPLGVRTEVKNLGSIRAVAKAIEFEISRQICVLGHGGIIENETRAYDMQTKQTLPMRDKEAKQDYRFMPEPNLPPLRLCDNSDSDVIKSKRINIDAIRSQLPQLPHQARLQLIAKHGLPMETAVILVNDDPQLLCFHQIMSSGKFAAKSVINFLFHCVNEVLNTAKLTMSQCPLSHKQLEEILQLISDETISPLISKKVLAVLFENNTKSALEVVNDNKWMQISDRDSLMIVCQEVIQKNTKLVKRFRAGKQDALRPLISSVMKSTNECANMRIVKMILLDLLAQT